MSKKIVKLMGGLGNQMFQYAFGYILAKKFNSKIVFDFSWFEDVKNDKNVTSRTFELGAFNLQYEIAAKEDLEKIVYKNSRSAIEKLLWKLFAVKKFKPQKNIYTQRNGYKFDKKLLSSDDYIYYEGYFQNEEYFKNERAEILKLFTSDMPPDEKNRQLLEKIHKTNSVSIHVRRGDYVTLENAKQTHGTCSLGYYKKAVEYIAKRTANPHFFIFSDDICWVVKNLNPDFPFTIIDINQHKGWLDLNLMKNCKHNIIANSSFSWWGAWLNENPNKIIISPKKWTRNKKIKQHDVIPAKWLKL